MPGIGDLIDGRFRIDRKLGEGGSSTVYQVSHIITDKKFAIKWLLPELALDEAAVDRFIHEARVGGKFAHPHAVQVYDICKANDSFYMLMELLEGESLQTRLERVGRLPVDVACSIILTCCEVIAAAHQVGIIHRDLKPANIFLATGSRAGGASVDTPKLLDFGISTFVAERQSVTGLANMTVSTNRSGVIGTPLYMAPEQMLGRPADERTDIYAVGAVLYELVSGQPPYQADNYSDLAIKVTVDAHTTPAPPLDKLPQLHVDPHFGAVVAKAMARDAEDRYASVTELMHELALHAQRRKSSPPAQSSPPRRALATPVRPIEIARTVEELQPPTGWGLPRKALLVAVAGCAVAFGWSALSSHSTPVAPVTSALAQPTPGAGQRELDSNVLTMQAPRDALAAQQLAPLPTVNETSAARHIRNPRPKRNASALRSKHSDPGAAQPMPAASVSRHDF